MSAAERDTQKITEWALAAGRGDRAAAAAFIRATQEQTHRFLLHLTDPGVAEDLCQETYLRAISALPSFAGRSSALTWLLAIARRVAADHIRTLVRRPRTASEVDWGRAIDVTPAGDGSLEDEVILRALLRGLPVDRREAFVATQLLGLTYAEAAQVSDCPVGTIRSRVARAREDLIVAYRDSGSPPRALRAIS
ncbi:sigma-70 family RNA polymerase sigma factor [Frankia sp. AgPm24]|uniref:sigma-70 family RNA polymerase sigma factor n=1 Tax=Frankia sp. AgPm24 TaxID=631128 RepID=UPI0027E24517|nr:sigma-70 family RNA polymerase sigma factor [Frankia sp. AgPm24]